jgi:A/G-specific adenine glycosylase
MTTRFEHPITAWYAAHARDLPWRRPGVGSWPILVSEIMLQQTPVSRVLPAYHRWLQRWPAPATLAAATPAEAVRQWDRLGYPRRAVRLHAAAIIITERHGGEVPDSLAALRALPGVGPYTAAAVASFAFGQRHAVLDTNVRRVLARLIGGRDQPEGSSPGAVELRTAESLLPAESGRAARWSVAVMELGALVCARARPACELCPLAGDCAWRLMGSPPGPSQRRAPRYEGSDRQARGAVLAALRAATAPIPPVTLDAHWPDQAQRSRVLAALMADGLVSRYPGGLIGLHGDADPTSHRLRDRTSGILPAQRTEIDGTSYKTR